MFLEISMTRFSPGLGRGTQILLRGQLSMLTYVFGDLNIVVFYSMVQRISNLVWRAKVCTHLSGRNGMHAVPIELRKGIIGSGSRIPLETTVYGPYLVAVNESAEPAGNDDRVRPAVTDSWNKWDADRNWMPEPILESRFRKCSECH